MASNGDNCSELEAKIIQQIEYYFGDINLQRDKFLREESTKDDGWISLDTLFTFNRLKSLIRNTIVSALRKSSADLLEISDCGLKIRRKVDKPLPELTDEYKTSLNERTVHIKGFPLDSSLDEIMAFCKQFGSVEGIEMRKTLKNKSFKGCIFTVFATKEEAETVLNANDLTYKQNSLLRENKVRYFERKKKYHESRKNKNKPTTSLAEKCDTESNDDEASEDKVETPAKAESSHIINAKNPIKNSGSILKLKGISKETTFYEIKKVFVQHGRVEYVENVNDNLESFVRFAEKDGAKYALERAKIVDQEEGEAIKVEINGQDVIAEVLTGDEELQFWNNYQQNKISSIENRNKNRGKYGGGRQRGRSKNLWQRGSGHKRSAKESDVSEVIPAKQVKVENESEPNAKKIKIENGSQSSTGAEIKSE